MGARDEAAGTAAAAALQAEGIGIGGVEAVALQLDVTDDRSIARAAAQVDEACGRLDVLVNNAGADYDTWERAGSVDFATVDHALATNLVGAWRMAVAFLPLLRRSPHGRIVNVSSESGSLAGMGGGTPALRGVQGRAERPDPRARSRAAARSGSSSTRCARAGWPPTWEARAGGRWRRARRRSSGASTCPTMVRAAASSGTAGHCPGDGAQAVSPRSPSLNSTTPKTRNSTAITAPLCAESQDFHPSSTLRGAVAAEKVEGHRCGDAGARQQDVHDQPDRRLRPRHAELRQSGAGRQREGEVLGVDRAEDQRQTGRLHRCQRVDRGHPLGGRRWSRRGVVAAASASRPGRRGVHPVRA